MFPKKKPAGFGAPEPMEKKPSMMAPKRPPTPPVDDEARETPEEESQEEYGAKLLSDMTAPLIELGMDEDTAKDTLVKMFTAMAKCLGGGAEEPEGGTYDGDELGSGSEQA